MHIGRKKDGTLRRWFAWRPVYDEYEQRYVFLQFVKRSVVRKKKTYTTE